MTAPQSLTGTTRPPRRSMHHGATTPRGVSARPSLARGRAGTRSMSGGGRCARRKQRALRVRGSRTRAAGSLGKRTEHVRQGQGWRLGKDQGAGEMDQRADRTAVVRSIVLDLSGSAGVTCVRHSTHPRWRPWICPPISAPSGRDARGRTSARAGTQAQTAPGTNPISTVIGTSPSSSRLRVSHRPADRFLRADAATLVTM